MLQHPNKTQAYHRDICVKNAKEGAGEHKDVVVTYEDVLISGALLIGIQIKAKPGTGMLFLLDRSYLVKVGPRGGVMSKLSDGNDNRWKRNKYCTF